jgi:hypothetical protein
MELKPTKVDDELNYLKASDPLLPPDADATSALEIIPIHYNMDRQIKGNWHPGHSSKTNQLGIAKKSGSTVVIGVKEC